MASLSDNLEWIHIFSARNDCAATRLLEELPGSTFPFLNSMVIFVRASLAIMPLKSSKARNTIDRVDSCCLYCLQGFLFRII